ncbi:probable FeS assembly SUF system protein SufT [Oryzisolibacter propanilivorax]|uniref:Probable FeS assembly SUF system protein SufT n=1 Tax=Oryzisolibacter propanilivorax TaxID=1527607 RepID=A0A1G9STZ8_9BURK|nr:putative Fe-S cluster assembly protein SufT [Oryzisolibacter propanilivorax]SDM38824.1 probable FeS assembly SUF system protein SufT [Oryzisolibacter propanilivorax]
MTHRRHREDVLVRRTVTVETIPSGMPVELEAGQLAQITQALGGSFTLLVEGQLMRLKGQDADAIGKTPPETIAVPADLHVDDLEPLVWKTLATCYDPEIPVNIVDLGLVYRVAFEPLEDADKVRAVVDMTLTAPGCGMGEAIADEVCDKILALPGVGEITVNLVFDPPWDRSRMSEAAQLALGL